MSFQSNVNQILGTVAGAATVKNVKKSTEAQEGALELQKELANPASLTNLSNMSTKDIEELQSKLQDQETTLLKLNEISEDTSKAAEEYKKENRMFYANDKVKKILKEKQEQSATVNAYLNAFVYGAGGAKPYGSEDDFNNGGKQYGKK